RRDRARAISAPRSSSSCTSTTSTTRSARPSTAGGTTSIRRAAPSPSAWSTSSPDPPDSSIDRDGIGGRLVAQILDQHLLHHPVMELLQVAFEPECGMEILVQDDLLEIGDRVFVEREEGTEADAAARDVDRCARFVVGELDRALLPDLLPV